MKNQAVRDSDMTLGRWTLAIGMIGFFLFSAWAGAN